MIEFIKENIKTIKCLIENAKNANYPKSVEEWSMDLKKYEDLLIIVEAFEVVKLQLLECSSEHDLYAFCLAYGCLQQREDYLKIEKALNINLRL